MLQDTLNRHFKYLVHNIEIWITFQQLQAQLAPRNTWASRRDIYSWINTVTDCSVLTGNSCILRAPTVNTVICRMERTVTPDLEADITTVTWEPTFFEIAPPSYPLLSEFGTSTISQNQGCLQIQSNDAVQFDQVSEINFTL